MTLKDVTEQPVAIKFCLAFEKPLQQTLRMLDEPVNRYKMCYAFVYNGNDYLLSFKDSKSDPEWSAKKQIIVKHDV